MTDALAKLRAHPLGGPIAALAPALVLLGVLAAASAAYIAVFDFWGLKPYGRGGLGLPMMAYGYGLIFWSLVFGLSFYAAQLSRFGWGVFAGVAVVLGLLLAAAWPGFMVADSFMAVKQGVVAPVNTWLGPMPWVIQSVLQHVPNLGALAIFQVAGLALALAHACQYLRQDLRSRLAPWLCLAISLSSVVLLYDAILITRDTWFAVTSLFLAVECCRFFTQDDWRNGRTAGRILLLAVLGWLLRSDGVGCVGAAGLVIGARFVFDRRPAARAAFAAAALLPAVLLLGAAKVAIPVLIPSGLDRDAYEMTVWLSPIESIVREDADHLDPKALQTVYRAIPREAFEGPWDPASLNIFWTYYTQRRLNLPKTAPDRAELRGAVVTLIAARPDVFIENRAHLLAAAILPGPPSNQLTVHPVLAFSTSPFPARQMATWSRVVSYAAPLPARREAVENSFAASVTSPLGRLEWSVLPELLVAAAALAFVRRAPGLAFAGAVLLARLPLVIAFAPEPQIKYFLSFELAAPFLLAVMFVTLRRRPAPDTASG